MLEICSYYHDIIAERKAMSDIQDFTSTPYGKFFDEYLEWMTKNASRNFISDKNFFLFLMSQPKILEHLAKSNVDVNALDMWITKSIKKEQKRHNYFSKEEIYFENEMPIAGFFGKVYSDFNEEASAIEFLDETIMSMESAYNLYDKGSSKYHIFGFDKTELAMLRDFGLTKDNICPDLKYANRFKTYQNKDMQDFGDLALEECVNRPIFSHENINKVITTTFNEDLLRELGAVRLTKQAEDGKLDDFIGRDKELDNLGRILCRVEKPNAIITGGPGVGKTALIEGLAQRIADGNIHPKLQGREIISLNLNGIKSGNTLRGMLEEKIKNLIDEVKKTNSILYIDEIHALKSKDRDDEDLASALKTEITKGGFSVIGSTTTAEYTKSIAKDPAFARRFQEIKLSEPDRDMTINILNNLKSKYEYNYEILIPKKMIEEVVDLSSRFMRKYKQPDAAKTLLDDSCSFATGNKLNLKNIHTSLSQITNVPVSDLVVSEQAKIMRLPETIGQQVIGQESALSSIRNSLLHQMILPSENKPKATYLFCGPSGVGKTQIAKDLAKLLNTELVTFNMSEYQQSNDVSKLVGAAPGYIGYDEGGLLVNKVNDNPCAVVLLDEIEKAHPDIYKVLLQVMDEGKLADNQGNLAHFNNTILIMTSNAGYGSKSGHKVVGYRQPDESNQTKVSKENLLSDLHKVFKPEFLGRIGSENIIAFQPLDLNSSVKIVENQLQHFSERFEKKYQIKLDFDNELKEYIAKTAIKPEFGARNLSAYINTNIVGTVSQAFIKNEIKKGDNIMIKAPEENSQEIRIIQKRNSYLPNQRINKSKER